MGSSKTAAPPADSVDDAAEANDVSMVPAIMAGCAGLLMLFFVTCAVGTYFLFGKQTELAARTLRETLIPMVEQSNLAPSEKEEVLDELQLLLMQTESGQLENWQAGGTMQRLRLIPIVQWGDLDAILGMTAARQWSEEEQEDVALQVSRVKHGVQLGLVRASDIDRILEPVTKPVDDVRDRVLDRSVSDEKLRETVERLRLLANHADVPEQWSETTSLLEVVRDAIAAGKAEGAI